MNTPALLRATVLAFAVGAFAVSATNAEPQKRRGSSKTLDQSEEERHVVITGSHVPQKVKVKSIGTDSVHNVRIYTHRELISTGRQSVGEALALDPSIQLTGSR